jgi:ribosomal protein L11 methyltransferase
MPTIVETLSPAGCLILSGFYEEDAALLVEKAETLGLKESHRTVDNNWTMLAFKRG